MIDVEVVNTETVIADISNIKQWLKEQKILKKNTEIDIGKYIEREGFNHLRQPIENSQPHDQKNIDLYILNRKCLHSKHINPDGTFKLVGGISPTGTGVAYITLGNDNYIKGGDIIHEIMHALGLKHTFDTTAMHTFIQGSTKNYMDYDNTKKQTHYYQWKKMHTYPYLK